MVYSTRRFVLSLSLCYFVLVLLLFFFLFCFFVCLFVFLLALQLLRLEKRELILMLFVRLFELCFFGFCLFPLPLGVWDGMRLVIVALSGLFSYVVFVIFREDRVFDC